MKNIFSVKIKIFILISSFFAIVVMGFISYNLEKSKSDFLGYLYNLNTTSSSLIVKNTKSDLYNLNYTNVKNTIDSFSNEYFKDIYILDTNGMIFASRGSDILTFHIYPDFEKFKTNSFNSEKYYFTDIKLSKKHLGYLLIEVNTELIELQESKRKDEMINISLVALLVIVLISYMISSFITAPIKKMVNKLESLKDKDRLNFKYDQDDEFGTLSTIIEKKHAQIHNLNTNLENLVKEEVEKNRLKDLMLEKQSMRASLGEMMDSVAHQWKQPLNFINTKSQELVILSVIQEVKPEDIEKCADDISIQIKHMVNTLDEFRGFFRDDKRVEKVSLKVVVEETLALLKSDIIKNNLKIEVEQNSEILADVIPNEFKHVLINFLSNTQDAFVINEIDERDISISFEEDENSSYLIYQDNAGGIPEDIIEHIFTANFTTKGEIKGTGVGLYMSKMIIEKIDGEILVENKNGGVCFNVMIPKKGD